MPIPRSVTNVPFDLDAVAAPIGYPMYMKPYDGGGWRRVSRIRNAEELHRAYNESGGMLMHLQAAVEGYDIFARTLSIGAETMVMSFGTPASQCMTGTALEYQARVRHWRRGRNDLESRQRVLPAGNPTPARCSSRTETSFPIDYANACPDVAVTCPALLLPGGDASPQEMDGLLPGDRAAAAYRS